MEHLNPNNTNLKSFDLKIKLLIAESVEDEKKKELEALNMKISQVDQLILEKQQALKLASESVDNKKKEQEICKTAEPSAKFPQQDDNSRPTRNVESPVARSASSLQRKPPVVSGSNSTSRQLRTIMVYSETGFEMIKNHEIHQVFSEAGKVLDIVRSDDGLQVLIEFDSIASANSAVKVPPSNIGDLGYVQVYHV